MEPSSAERSRGEEPRLNPFALPSDTTARFAVLVVAVITSSLFVFSLIYLALPSTGARYEQARVRCPADAMRDVPESAPALVREEALVRAVSECRRSFDLRQAVAITLAVGVLLLVAVAQFLLTPRWKIRRRRLVPLDPDDAPELCTAFGLLCDGAGLSRSRRPVLLWNPLAPRGDALAFGRFRRSYVALGAGLVAEFYVDGAATTAVLRHELAHVVNRDLTKAYFAVSLWRAFAVVCLLPLVALELVWGERVLSEHLSRAGALALLVYAVRNAVLRAREYYADAWAASSPPARASLARMFDARGARSSFLTKVARVHPDPGLRLRVLTDTDELFRLRLWDAAGAGVFAGFAFPTLKYLLFLLVPLGDYTLYVGAAAAVVSASFLGVVVGIQSWRATLLARVRDTPLPRTAPFAVAATLGFAAGYRLSFTTEPLTALATFFLVLFTVTTLHWLAATADAWFDAAPGTDSGSRFAWAGLVAAALSLWGTGWFSVLNVAARQRPSPGPFDLANLVALHTYTPFAVLGLMAFPLAAWWLRRRVSTDRAPAWVVPDTGPDSVAWPVRPALAVGSSLRLGALGGGLFCLAMMALHIGGVAPRDVVEPFAEAAFQYGKGPHYAPLALAVLAQGVVSVVVAIRAVRLPVLHALFALSASFALMTVGVIVPDLISGEGMPYDTGAIARLVLAGGAFAALLVGGAVFALRHSSRRFSSIRPYSPRAESPAERDEAAPSLTRRTVT
jgi:Zn-dependent protease with chaperone function